MPTSPVLVVEDDPDTAKLLTTALDVFGIPSVRAPNGEDALRLAREITPPVVLLDLGLPDIDGIDVASRLKVSPPTHNIPIIAITVRSRKDDLDLALQAGCDDYLAKPFDIKDLIAKIRKYLSSEAA